MGLEAYLEIKGEETPYHTTVKEYHQERYGCQRAYPANNATQKKKGCQTINQSGSADVVSLPAHTPQKESANNINQYPDLIGDIPVEIKEGQAQKESRKGIVQQVLPVSMDQGGKQYSFQTAEAPGVNTTFHEAELHTHFKTFHQPEHDEEKGSRDKAVDKAFFFFIHGNKGSFFSLCYL